MQSNDNKIRLNKKQMAFVIEVTGIPDIKEAVKRFATIMVEEKMHPSDMSELINKIFERNKAK